MGRNFEKLIEHIINSDDAAARKLFHSIVVSKSRSIYENLEMEGMMHGEEDEEMEEGVGDIVDSVELDQTSDMMEADDEDMAPEMGDDDMGDDDMDHDMKDMGDDEDMETRVDDLESALDELKAEFEKLMSDEEGEEAEDEGEEAEDEGEEAEDEDEEMEELEEGAEEDEEDEEVEEGLIREYTEKAPAPVKTEVTGTNTKSSVAGKNDMGGTAKNLAQGGEEKGRTAPSAKPMGVNDPKAAGKVAFKSQAPKAVSKEQAGINKDSVFESRKSTKKSPKK